MSTIVRVGLDAGYGARNILGLLRITKLVEVIWKLDIEPKLIGRSEGSRKFQGANCYNTSASMDDLADRGWCHVNVKRELLTLTRSMHDAAKVICGPSQIEIAIYEGMITKGPLRPEQLLARRAEVGRTWWPIESGLKNFARLASTA